MVFNDVVEVVRNSDLRALKSRSFLRQLLLAHETGLLPELLLEIGDRPESEQSSVSKCDRRPAHQAA